MKGIPSAVRTALKQKAFHKYGAIKTTCLYGHTHDSKKEAMWCVRLEEMQKERKISCLENQKTFELKVNNILVCKHKVDFFYLKLVSPDVYVEEVVEVKGMKTRDWIIKHKLFCALYPQIKYVVV